MEKISFIYLKDFLDFIYTEFIYLFFFFIFFLTNACLACRLHKAYTVLWAANSFVGTEAPNHNAFEQFWKFEFHFEHFPRNTRFLRFDGSINHLFLVKNHQQKFSWPGKRPSSHIQFTKMGLGQNINYCSETLSKNNLLSNGYTKLLF